MRWKDEKRCERRKDEKKSSGKRRLLEIRRKGEKTKEEIKKMKRR